MKKIYTVILSGFLFSCTASKIDYVGSKSSPTDKIDVYVDEKTIVRPYDVVGKGYERPNWKGVIRKERILEMAITKAKQNGADAVFFKEMYIPAAGTNVSTHSRTDSLGKNIITNSSTAISPVYGYWHREVLFLKYK